MTLFTGDLRLYSVGYVLQRYVFTPSGIAAMVAIVLAIWGVNHFESGNTSNSPSGSLDEIYLKAGLQVWFFWWFLIAIVGAFVGALIDGWRGALWGFFLGPIGWIIVAIRRLESREAPKSKHHVKAREMKEPKEAVAILANKSEAYDVKKWNILKEVDPEIKAASDRVVAVDPMLDAVLAEKYLHLSQKEYLQPLVDKLLADAAQKSKKTENSDRDATPGIYESSGPFKFRILPNKSVSVFSGPSGSLEEYEHFEDLSEFFDANLTRGARPETVRKIE